MSDYTPELGQKAFSNTLWQEFNGDTYETGLSYLGEVLEEVLGYNPAGNVGGDGYVSDLFEMRAYCWCDGEAAGHEDDCPPNFVHHPTGLVVSWYKYLGRGMSANKHLTASEWARAVVECVNEVFPLIEQNNS